MKKLFLLAVVILLAGSVVLAGEKVSVTVKGMVCSFCAHGLDKKFKAEPSVDEVTVSLEKKAILIRLKEDQRLGDDRIKKIVQDAGYDVHAIKRDPQ